jgi:phenylpropionate dioxygenase-like ring-hydroxylating dioxygenase large terminal subunit
MQLQEDAGGVSVAPSAGLVPVKGLTRGHASVARVTRAWYIAARSEELRAKPIVSRIWDMPIVLFRDGEGRATALIDRCPHRNVPLSMGHVVGGRLECAYHGWQFKGGKGGGEGDAGRCVHIPSRAEGDPDGPARRAPSFPVREHDGFIWVYTALDATPDVEPYRFRLRDVRGYTSLSRSVTAQCTVHAATENALDVPHTAFLHRGLFRAESRGLTITAAVRRSRDRVETEYLGEPRPVGLVARILSPSGGMVTHFDRFLLPSVSEVEYKIGDENHILIASAMTPISDFETRLHAVVSFRLRIPHFLAALFLRPLAMKVFSQDAIMLRAQTEAIRRFGGEQYASTEIDVMGRHIWRLLRQAERGDAGSDEVHEERVALIV